MSEKRISYKVDGDVQGLKKPGVSFRYFTQKQANSIGISGFVRNASDGSVEGEAQGSDEALEEFVKHLKSGPSAANVTDVEHSEIPPKSGESGFNVSR